MDTRLERAEHAKTERREVPLRSFHPDDTSKEDTMRSTRRLSTRVVMTVLSALSFGAVSVPVTAAPAAAKPTTPIPVCAGAKDLVVDVTQDVRNQPFLPARDGRMWANFSVRPHAVRAAGVRLVTGRD
jgi:hypothetical protein